MIIIGAIEDSHETALMITDANAPAIRRGLSQLRADDRALGEVAERLIEKSIWWYDHPQGDKVRAPAHSKHIRTGKAGLELQLGDKKFLIGNAIVECAAQVDSFLDGLTVEAASES